MVASLWSRLSDIVPDALERSGQEREDFLTRACRTATGEPDLALRAEAEAMVEAAEAADATGAFLSPVPGTTASVADDEHIERNLLPERIGPWKIDGVLGEGGMGVVYLAHRDDGSFTRDAALKRLRPGLGSGLAERLRAERQILASLDHPSIARLYDGGIAEDGTPYLVMEYVRGEPVTTYAERDTLGTRDRVRLGLAVTEAVAYAHRHLVVHRDVKPSNVLVTTGDAAREPGAASPPRVKLLDFGLAKLLEPSGDPLLTAHGVMTPAYAAPEQFRGGAVTTATDVYALGVLLFELLSGNRPYSLADMSPAEAERIVCETQPLRPSDVAPTNRTLRGDLDGIVLRAMAKDPTRRYASAEGLADDLRRYLSGRPVEARSPTLGYLASRFVRRHRVAVTGAIGLLIAAVALLAAYTVGLRAERDRARLAEAEAAEQAERAEAIAGFLEDILRAPNPRWYVEAETKGPETPIRAVLDEAAARIERDFADRPDLRADLRHVLGDTYLALGLADQARAHHRAVLSIREQIYPDPHPKLAEALYYAGVVAPTAHEEIRLYERAADMLRRQPGGNNLPFILNSLASRYLYAGQAGIAESLAREAHAFVAASFTPGTDGFRYREPSLRYSSQFIARALAEQGKTEEAERWLPSRPPFDMSELCALGSWHAARKETRQAEQRLRACWEAAPSPRHMTAEWAASALMALYASTRTPERAQPYREAAARHYARQDSLRRALDPLLVSRD